MKTSPSNIRIAYQNSTANKASINQTVEAVKNKGSTTQQLIGKVSHTDKQDFFLLLLLLLFFILIPTYRSVPNYHFNPPFIMIIQSSSQLQILWK